MRLTAFGLMIALLVGTAQGQSNTAIKYDYEIVEKLHPVKIKAGKHDPTQSAFVFLIEQTKDAVTPDDLQNLKTAFKVNAGNQATGTNIIFLFFDEDNVLLGKQGINRMEGEITGRKGDAFRVTVSSNTVIREKIRKIEPRQADPTAKFEDSNLKTEKK